MKKLLIVCTMLCGCGQGPQGNPGVSGPAGQSIIGPQGIAGTNGTTFTIVQFCKNPVTTYPNTFSEVAYCVNDVLYGVYSANDGFLAALPNGNYTSDGINASCDFTINGCTISNQSN